MACLKNKNVCFSFRNSIQPIISWDTEVIGHSEEATQDEIQMCVACSLGPFFFFPKLHAGELMKAFWYSNFLDGYSH